MSGPPPIPKDEAERVAALRSYGVLDTLPEDVYDDLAFIASVICDVPIALVSLVDESRQFLKARVGLDVTETPRNVAFCAHAIAEEGPMVVGDAQLDPRFVDNPFVTGAPEIRFYAGFPLRTTEGHALGTLCVIDRKPRALSDVQMKALAALSRQVMVQLELRRALSASEDATMASKPHETVREMGTRIGDLVDRIERLRARSMRPSK